MTLNDFDIFFYYGLLAENLELQSDLLVGILQGKRSMYYNRQDGGGAGDLENHPNDLLLQIMARFDISNYVSWRNTIVTDGTAGTRDRRAAVSQFSIDFVANGGDLDITVYYLPFAEYNKLNQNNIPSVKMTV